MLSKHFVFALVILIHKNDLNNCLFKVDSKKALDPYW